MTDERSARVLLSLIGEPGDPRLTGLVADLGAVAVMEALRSQSKHGELRESLTERLRAARPDAVMAAAEKRDIRFVTPDCDEWPEGLDDLATSPLLHERGGVPVGLWVRGALRLDEVCRTAVAVVGARSATTYGVGVAGDLAATVAEAGTTVVSGAAFGIDQAAHRGALAVRGSTVAILASGVDRPYPQAHTELLDYIAEVGLVVSEAPPGAAPRRIRFLARNRLIAALTQGTVVVEAAVRSGALNTAHWAAGLNRMLMGVPGPVTSATSQGVHQLMRTKNALVITGGADVLEATAEVGSRYVEREQGPLDHRDSLTGTQRQVLDAVPVIRAAAAASIARSAGLPGGTVTATLAELFEVGLVERSGAHWRLSSRLRGSELDPS